MLSFSLYMDTAGNKPCSRAAAAMPEYACSTITQPTWVGGVVNAMQRDRFVKETVPVGDECHKAPPPPSRVHAQVRGKATKTVSPRTTPPGWPLRKKDSVSASTSTSTVITSPLLKLLKYLVELPACHASHVLWYAQPCGPTKNNSRTDAQALTDGYHCHNSY